MATEMKLAIASGKGGTGKTTVATNLAWVAGRKGQHVAYLDCDVEKPNGHLFLNPEITSSVPVGRPHPVVDDRQVHALRPVRRDLPVQRDRVHRSTR